MIGATGQIGCAAVRALAADGWRVHAASRSGDRDGTWPDGASYGRGKAALDGRTVRIDSCRGESRSTVAEIAAAIDEVPFGGETVLADGPPAGSFGATPWSLPRPVVLGVAAAERELGYRAVTGYAESLPATVDWIVRRLEGRAFEDAFGGMAEAYSVDLIDYAAEDAWLAARRGASSGGGAG